ncbi:MAG: putative DNA modification/repair radical SAM protein [candidate division KSB1 bacterium]|nr:putative DNA modification/repair radical SAM protein [candidate division KSB1 bacterium]
MDSLQKINILGQAAQYDLCGSYQCTCPPRARGPFGRWIYPAVMPDGKTILLLKVLMSNFCENDCYYCFNRYSRDFQRISFQPEELAKLFMDLYYRRQVQGLFLSSAVCGSVNRTMEQMIKTAELLRLKYKFRGYIHLKILPGASFDYVLRATQLADRVSVNLEAPNPERLAKLTTKKELVRDILTPMKWIHGLQQQEEHQRLSQTTQFVVGAAGESDQEILRTTDWLYRKLGLTRAYYSAFQPVKDTPLENHPATPLMREHRLYQTDFLFRRYGFRLEEISFDDQGNLPIDKDPKLVWALKHPERFPVEINQAAKEDLMRVPGIGPITANRIIKNRLKNKFSDLTELKGLGVVVKRAAPFILIKGKVQHQGLQLAIF